MVVLNIHCNDLIYSEEILLYIDQKVDWVLLNNRNNRVKDWFTIRISDINFGKWFVQVLNQPNFSERNRYASNSRLNKYQKS